MLVAHYFASFDGILVYVAQIHGKHCSTEHWKRGFMVRVCLHLLAKRFWRPWFFGRPGRNCCWTKGGGLAESGPSLLWLVPQPTPSSLSKLKYSQISKCTTTKIHKHASTKKRGAPQLTALERRTSASGSTILIQMWSLAGPVTNRRDDVWEAQPANFF